MDNEDAYTLAYGRNLRAWRETLRITLATACELIEERQGLQLSVPALSNIENGKRALRLEEAAKIAAALNVDLGSLARRRGTPINANYLIEATRAELSDAERTRRAAEVVVLHSGPRIEQLKAQLGEMESDGEHREEA